MKNITSIKNELELCNEKALGSFILSYTEDERTGVKKLVDLAKRRLAAYEEELIRIGKMRKFDNKFTDGTYICGVDEVGRGPLAGPVVAAAVIFPKDCIIPYINDSKKLSHAKRKQLFDEIMNSAISVGFGSVDNHTIDKINILNATFEAMRMAVSSLSVQPDFILVDGNKEIPGLSVHQQAVVKGDAHSISIAAASIAAKVVRDTKMEEYHNLYPMYDFSSNKGYNSQKHKVGLKDFGLSPIHRKTFIHL